MPEERDRGMFYRTHSSVSAGVRKASRAIRREVELLGTFSGIAIGRIRFGRCAGGHAGKCYEVGLHLCPCGGILLCGDRRRRVGIVNLNVLLDAGRYGLLGRLREAVKEIGVCGVGEQVASRLHYVPSVEVAIG